MACCLQTELGLLIETSEEAGRYVQATKSFVRGEVVLRNHSSSYVLSQEQWGNKCLRCFGTQTDSSALLRCSSCKLATYCSKGCQSKDWRLHKAECGHLKSLVSHNLDFATMNEVLLLIRSFNTSKSRSPECQLLVSGNLVSCGHQHCDNVFCPIISSHTAVDHVVISVIERLLKIAKDVIARKMDQFRCNNFGITDEIMNCIGSGEYPAAALLNHSCTPNCILRFKCSSQDGPVLEIIACRDIIPGEELCHSYCDLVATKVSRQEKLSKVYLFSCKCSLCLHLENGLEVGNILQLIKENHSQPLIVRSLLQSLPPFQPVLIDSLLTEIVNSTDKSLAVVQHRQAQVERFALAAETRAELSAAVESLITTEAELCSSYGQFHIELYKFRGNALSTLLLLPDDSRCMEYARRICAELVSFLCLSFVNVPYHPLLAVQLFTLADLTASSEGRQEEAVQLYRWCEEILRVTHGEYSKLMSHLQHCLASIK